MGEGRIQKKPRLSTAHENWSRRYAIAFWLSVTLVSVLLVVALFTNAAELGVMYSTMNAGGVA